MRRPVLLLAITMTLALSACALRPPNPDLEAEQMAINACRETASGFGGGGSMWQVSFDMCMDQSGYSRKDRQILWP